MGATDVGIELLDKLHEASNHVVEPLPRLGRLRLAVVADRAQLMVHGVKLVPQR